MPRGATIMADVIREVEKRRGQMITLDELMKVMPESASRASVQRVMLTLVQANVGLTVLSVGTAWQLAADPTASPLAEAAAPKPSKATARPSALPPIKPGLAPSKKDLSPRPGDVFEYVGSTEAGGLLRDAEGRLWSAKRM